MNALLQRHISKMSCQERQLDDVKINCCHHFNLNCQQSEMMLVGGKSIIYGN